MTSSLLVVPVGILTHLTHGVVTLIMTPPSGARGAAAGLEVARFSELMTIRLLIAELGGFPLLLIVLVFGVGNLFAARVSKTSNALERFSWSVVVVVAIAAFWNVVALTITIQSIERALARTKAMLIVLERLAAACRKTRERCTWLERLPHAIRELQDRWFLGSAMRGELNSLAKASLGN